MALGSAVWIGGPPAAATIALASMLRWILISLRSSSASSDSLPWPWAASADMAMARPTDMRAGTTVSERAEHTVATVCRTAR